MSTNPNHWLLITTRGYWKILQTIHEWAFQQARKEMINAISERDFGVIYLTSDGGRIESAIGGIVQFTSEKREESNYNIPFNAIYPLRIKFNPVYVPEHPIPFKPLIEKMSFITAGKYWGASLQGQPMKRISKDDYQFIWEWIHITNN